MNKIPGGCQLPFGRPRTSTRHGQSLRGKTLASRTNALDADAFSPLGVPQVASDRTFARFSGGKRRDASTYNASHQPHSCAGNRAAGGSKEQV